MGVAQDQTSFHVLAVDDSLIDRKLIERLLLTSSYRVTTVDSGSKALEFLGFREVVEVTSDDSEAPTISSTSRQGVEVNLIITDYCMPGMTGYDLLKKIKESSSLRNIPVVIMSSENVPSRITECLEEGAEFFFLKPVRQSDLHRLRPLMKPWANNSDDHGRGDDDKDNDHPQQQQQKEFREQNHQHEPQQQPSSESASSNSNKRKAANANGVEEGLSPDRTRVRYRGFTAHTHCSITIVLTHFHPLNNCICIARRHVQWAG
ncbi:hypothetical protein MLD38_031000 [Melastoma candidum]|uniref:Uncharacterized protein n=1 Tax=Melastoma candidum TaxID=119954 RepID=A0ACB9MMS1_9MYRT|nr:hypothetical protein MLD38_031000 [Melastoma candidum]